MAYYQNIFTQVQVRAEAPDMGVAHETIERTGKGFFVHLFGRFGNAQIGPIYLGHLGVVSLLCGFIAFEIIGLNMWASVNWSPSQFLRQLFWLALEPPPPQYGLRIMPPLREGDRVALLNAGGYGAAMSSNHCMRGDFEERVLP